MDKNFYLKYAAVEDQHWWFVGRRQIVEKLIRQLKLPNNAKILEAGCGTGGNLRMLARYGEVAAMEFDETACQLANERQVTTVQQGSLPDQIPFNDQYDLVVILDVLEHIDDDLAALEALSSRLKPNSWLLITVPAYQFLWSYHDEINYHKRRYTLNRLKRVVKLAGYNIRYGSYFNTWLFPLVAGVRLLKNLLKLDKKSDASGDLNLPAQPINQFLTFLFASERYLINRFSLPFGVSVVLMAQKNQSNL
ncbi:bifunctional 2-polyprenyl-6-hydroxyphenol methylase/3-demethylubiquinol 3-O-methyltransferase UbiG [Nostoc sp. FACHB-280]|uniref:class I SAM-dependent methyltransferase n=1 Tax=Nostoc sp. FACHB-280 TaxID=2692839 RepID=UPI00168AED81|nr:class I SAM-dependent methyltransferase [Nostoc sp. FACHB-280]MBD2497025.1 class I SAM-dependent methyltransferase [Nostoc sp. FACHB-280]